MKLRISSRAQRDLEEIWEYIAEDDPIAATQFNLKLAANCMTLTVQPHLGRACEWLRPGLRRLVAGNYGSFYRVTPEQIEIVRIVHSTRDIQRLFGGEAG